MQVENSTQKVRVFFVPSHWSEKHQTQIVPMVIDTVVDRDGKSLSFYSGETLDELRKRYPTAEIGDMDSVLAEKENMMRTDPVECTEEDFWNALECLPPFDWQRTGSIGESFKLVERTSGRMTSIYARIGSKYWSFTDVDTMPHGEIMAKVKASNEKAQAETPQVAV